jgi:putative transposase
MRFLMSIIKLEVKLPEAQKAIKQFAENRIQAFETFTQEIKRVAETAINNLLNAEIDFFLGTPEEDNNKRNGYTEKDYTLKGIGTIRIKMPRDRQKRFASSIIPKSERVDPRITEDVAALHLAGLSTRTMSMMSQRILGIEFSPKNVSNSLEILSASAEKWLRRPIHDSYWALMVDGTNFKIKRRGSVEKEPSLVVIGIDEFNKKSILAIESGTRDDVKSWRAVFKDLKSRGLNTSKVTLGLMDGLPGLESLFQDEFPNSRTQRCWFHALQNILAKCPKRLEEPFHKLVSRIMYANSKEEALQNFSDLKIAMNKDAERSIACLEKDLESLLTFFSYDKNLWTSLRTTNGIERINKEFKRRTKSMEVLGEMTLKKVLAFTALRVELAWQRRAADTYKNKYSKIKNDDIKNFINLSLDGIGDLN